MSERLFGTDGIRGRAGIFPLDAPSLVKLGGLIGRACIGGTILVGRDTRESGPRLEAALCRGIASQAEVRMTGIIPTGAISHLLHCGDGDCGLVISASHNPADENGIKLFNRRGEKFPPRREKEIEKLFYLQTSAAARGQRRDARRHLASGRKYLAYLQRVGAELKNQLPLLVVDGANGSASAFAPELFLSLSASATFIHCRPDGRNINRDCGSTAPQSLCRRVVETRAELGIAFDGDADRVVFCDGRGRLLEGDHTLYLLGRYFQKADPNFPPIVVGTVMSNMGLERALHGLGLAFVRTAVGDRSVYLELKKRKARLGGEPAGHTILRQYQPCGDGLLTALVVLRALKFLGLSAADLFDRLPLFPQRVISLPIARRKNLAEWPGLKALENEFCRRQGDRARLLIRYSGTEPKIRLMIEAQDETVIQPYLDRFSTLIRSELGR